MEKFYLWAIAVLGSGCSYLFGGWSMLIEILVGIVILDYLTGMMAGATTGKLKSTTGFKGIAKKCMIFAVVAVAHMVDRIIGEGTLTLDMVTLFYISNEALSIIENAGKAGLPMPKKLKTMIEVLKDRSDPDDGQGAPK